MQTIETTVYTFDELNESAKEKARDWFRECLDSSDYEFVISDAAEILEMLGFDLKTRAVPLMSGKTRAEPCIYWSGFYSQNDGASFEAFYRYKPGSVRAVREYAPKDVELRAIAERLQAIQKRYFYGLSVRVYTKGRYCHEYTMQAEAEHSRDETRDISEAEADILECARDLARWVYKRLQDENEYINSEEYLDETITANEYTFTENGARFG